MKDKFRMSALLAGILIMVAPIMKLIGRVLFYSFNGYSDILFAHRQLQFYFYIAAIVGLGLMVSISAFTKWAKIPAVVCILCSMPNLLRWFVEDFRMFWGEVSDNVNLWAFGNLFFALTELAEIIGLLMLGVLLIVSLIKPEFKALKLLAFIPFVTLIGQVCSFIVGVLLFFLGLGREWFFDWMFNYNQWVNLLGNFLYSFILAFGFLFAGISLRPKKVKNM